MSTCLPGFHVLQSFSQPPQPLNQFGDIAFPSDVNGQPIFGPAWVAIGEGDASKATDGALVANGTITFTVGAAGSSQTETLTIGGFGVGRTRIDFQQAALRCDNLIIGDNPFGEWVTLFHPGETVWWEVGGHVHAGEGDLNLESRQGNVEIQAEHNLCLWATGDLGVRMQLGQGGVSSEDFDLLITDSAVETRAPTVVGRVLQADAAGVAIPQLGAAPVAAGLDGEVVMVDDGQDVKLYVFCDTQWKATEALS